MDLQTKGGKPVTSENALSPNNFRAYSPQTADHNPSEQSAFTRRATTRIPTPRDPDPRG